MKTMSQSVHLYLNIDNVYLFCFSIGDVAPIEDVKSRLAGKGAKHTTIFYACRLCIFFHLVRGRVRIKDFIG